MKNKIIYISNIRLTDSVLRDYYIDDALNFFFEVEYWDIVSIVREDYEEYKTLNVEYLHYIKTYKELNGLILLPKNQNAIYVMLTPNQYKHYKLFRLMSKSNCKMVYFNSGIMPITKDVPRWRRIITRFSEDPFNFLRVFFNFLSMELQKKINLINKFEIEFVVGKSLSPFIYHAKKIVSINYFDYDHYKKIENYNNNIVNGKYILFIDHNAPYHSDARSEGRKWPNDEIYFKSLNRIIGLIEKSQNLKVVIAANPKARYGSEKYGGREFYRLMMPALSKQAEFIIVPYASSAISYAILNSKPMLFIYNDELMRALPLSVLEQENIAKYLNLDLYNADLITNGDQFIIRNDNRVFYDLYKYNFLTSHESENKISSQIFLEEVIKL